MSFIDMIVYFSVACGVVMIGFGILGSWLEPKMDKLLHWLIEKGVIDE